METGQKEESRGSSAYRSKLAAPINPLYTIKAALSRISAKQEEQDSSSSSSQQQAAGGRRRVLKVDLSGCKYELCE